MEDIDFSIARRHYSEDVVTTNYSLNRSPSADGETYGHISGFLACIQMRPAGAGCLGLASNYLKNM